MAYEKNPDEIGVLWTKTSSRGKKYYSGYLEIKGEKIDIIVFPNSGKSEKSPTARILKSKPLNKEAKAEPKKVETPVDDVPF